MSAIPYSIAKRISDQLGWPNKFYWSVFDVLINANTLGFLANAGKEWWKFKPETIETVLRHIIYRTIQFDKMFEFVRMQDVIKGMPCNAIAGCGLSEATIKNVLGQLSRDNFLIKLCLAPNGKKIITPLYGLNLPRILELIDHLWANRIYTEGTSKDEYEDRFTRKPSILMLRGRCLLKCCVRFSGEWEDAFSFLANYSEPVSNVDDFIKEWSGGFLVSEKETILERKANAGKQFDPDVAKCKKVRQLREEYLKEKNL
jgi:hypothetical protein